MKIVLRILNISSTWILPNHHHLHLWNCSYFSISDIKVDFYGNRKWWTRETSVTLFCLHLGRTCLYQLCTSEFLSHLYSSQSQYKCVMFCKSCFWEHPVICIFFFQCPYPSSDSCLSITFSCRYIDLYLICFFSFRKCVFMSAIYPAVSS